MGRNMNMESWSCLDLEVLEALRDLSWQKQFRYHHSMAQNEIHAPLVVIGWCWSFIFTDFLFTVSDIIYFCNCGLQCLRMLQCYYSASFIVKIPFCQSAHCRFEERFIWKIIWCFMHFERTPSQWCAQCLHHNVIPTQSDRCQNTLILWMMGQMSESMCLRFAGIFPAWQYVSIQLMFNHLLFWRKEEHRGRNDEFLSVWILFSSLMCTWSSAHSFT